MAFKIEQRLTTCNYTNGAGISRIKYIVIHYFGSLGTAKAVADYFKNAAAKASAHYSLDEGETVYQSVLDGNIAWHCGDSGSGTFKGKCTNSNSIGIEVRPFKIDASRAAYASDNDWYFTEATIDRLVEFVKYLMDKYNVPAENIIRHYDVTAKWCPRPMMGGDINQYYGVTGNSMWDKFKARISGNTVPAEDSNGCPYGISTTTVNSDSTGMAVKRCQWYLTQLGYDVGEIDGDCGSKTVAGIMQFQSDNALTADGICGPITWAVLESVLTLKLSNENEKEDSSDMAQETVYKTYEDIPDWGKPTIKKLLDKGLLTGDGVGLNIPNSMLRVLVIHDRAGLYDIEG